MNEQLINKLDEALASKCKQKDVPGMAIMVAKDGVPIYKNNYGFRDVDKQLPVTEDTIFPAASVTKSFSTLSIMILADQGKLSPEDLVIDWLPELKLPGGKYENELKIRHLLSNSGGFPGLGAVNRARAESIQNDPDGEHMANRLSYDIHGASIQTVEELMEIMSVEFNYRLLGKPGTTYNYSNEGFALLQEIIERASKQSFPEFVQKHIFNPLKMTHSTFLAQDLNNYERITEIYGYKEGFKSFHSPVWWNVGKIYTNGSLKTTVIDLIKYLELYRQNGTVNGEKIISADVLKQMITPQIDVPTGEKYGYGLKLSTYKGISLVGHPGVIKGGSAYVMVAEELGLTFAVLTNIGEFSAEGLALTALNVIAELPDTLTKKEIDPLSRTELEAYTGQYLSAEGRNIEVTLQGEQLQLTARNSQAFIEPVAEDTFVTTDGAKFKFLRFENGEIAGVFTGFRFVPKANSRSEAVHVVLR